MILALPSTALTSHSAGALAFLHEVRADEGDVVLAGLGEALVDVAVEQEHRNAGLLGRHDRRDERLLLARGQEDQSTPCAIIELTSATCLAAEPAASV